MSSSRSGSAGWPSVLFGVVLVLYGAVIAVADMRLLSLGGSWYDVRGG